MNSIFPETTQTLSTQELAGCNSTGSLQVIDVDFEIIIFVLIETGMINVQSFGYIFLEPQPQFRAAAAVSCRAAFSLLGEQPINRGGAL